jgi:hypothetical protein
MEIGERLVWCWDANFHVRPELTDEEKIDILNNGQKVSITKKERYAIIEKKRISRTRLHNRTPSSKTTT